MPDVFTEEGLARFGQVAASGVGDDKVPGLVALAASSDQVHAEVLGSLCIGGPPVERDSLFRIASTTKPITAMAALALVAEGLFGLEESVEGLLPELADRRVLERMDGPLDETVRAHRPITVRDLLTFTFGFGASADMFGAAVPWPIVEAERRLPLATLGPPCPDAQASPDEWIGALGSLPLIAQPGERWMYNTGASVLGVLVARAAKMPLCDVLRTRILDPLGCAGTTFWTEQTWRLPTAYLPSFDGLQVWDPPDGQWSRPPVFGDGASGLLSTADDLLAIARMMLRNGDPVLPGELVEQMTSDQLTPEQRERDTAAFLFGRSWGLCQAVATDGPRAGAYGWDGGLGTSWLVDPVHDLVVIVLTQRLFESPRLPKIHRDLQSAAYDALR